MIHFICHFVQKFCSHFFFRPFDEGQSRALKLPRSCPKTIMDNCVIPRMFSDSHFIDFLEVSCHPVKQQNISSIEISSFQNLSKIVSMGLGIHPQKGQRDNFTRESPCLQKSILGVSVCMKLSQMAPLSREDQTRFSLYVYAYTIN